MRSSHTDVPVGEDGSLVFLVRFPVITTGLMLVPATIALPFGLLLCPSLGRACVAQLSSFESRGARGRHCDAIGPTPLIAPVRAHCPPSHTSGKPRADAPR